MPSNKYLYHLDDYVLNLFCPNTNQVNTIEKYALFINQLHSFHKIESLYDKTFNTYSLYIAYIIFMNSLELNKNILTYESYFYSVCSGYISNNNLKITTDKIAKLWVNLVTIFNSLLAFTSKAKSVDLFTECYAPIKSLNSSVKSSSFFWSVPLILNEISETLTPVIFIPFNGTSLYSNMQFLNTINYFNCKVIHVVLFDMTNYNIKLETLLITPKLLNSVKTLLNKFVVDYEKSNLINCTVCPIKFCKSSYIFSNIVPIPYMKKSKSIKLLNTS